MSNEPIPERAVIRQHKGPSVVWLLPLLAALIAGWLGYKSYTEAGIMINVVFNSAEGLESGKTRVLYKGLPAGEVRSMHLNEDMRTITARIEMHASAEPLLTEDTLFWLVKPEVSLSGVSGLETLLSGYYIGVRPGTGAPARQFTATPDAPIAEHDEEGLYISLYAESARSLNRGSPVYFRDMEIGRVLDYRLTDDYQQVIVDLYIDPHYSHLIRKHSRFWNASGIEISANLPDLTLRMGSLASILAGGIQVHTPDNGDVPLAERGDQFMLYPSYEAAADGIQVYVEFPGTTYLKEGTEVFSRGVQIGRVTGTRISDDLQNLQARLLIDPRARGLLREGSRFWISRADLFNEQPSLQNLLRGQHVELIPGAGGERFRFRAVETPAILPASFTGLAVQLRADTLGSIRRGSPILYREMAVGEVLGHELSDSGDEVIVHAMIRQRYQHLVREGSRFWNASGIRSRFDLQQGLQVETSSLAAIATGGIAFSSDTNGAPAIAGQPFTLYPDERASRENYLSIQIEFPPGPSLQAGSQIRFRDQVVGMIDNLKVLDSTGRLLAQAILYQEGHFLARSGTAFWVVEPQIRLTGIEHAEGLLTGNHVAVEPGRGEETSRFVALDEPPAWRPRPGLNLVLTSPTLGSIAVGSNVFHRGVAVGQITGFQLSQDASRVEIYANIRPRYEQLINQSSVFRNIGGLRASAGLFKGVDISAQSLETILAGGIEFTTPDAAEPVSDGSHFQLLQADNR